MARDNTGPKGEPQYTTLGVPADAADLTEIGVYAATVGNYKVGLASDRAALTGAFRWEGLRFYETDTGITYLYRSGGWVAQTRVVAQPLVAFPRVSANATDTFTSGSFASLAGGTITGAPAGNYLIGCNASLFGSVASLGNLRLLAGGASVSVDIQHGLTTQPEAVSYISPFAWSGGDLVLALQYTAASGVGSINKNGTSVWAMYVSP
ncbi:hypothetical protein KPL76_06145 [Subtercola sp. PAMC28395]|uniref:hypothetical protein n=1 Tax=Subtercola sp. PAMC28395 TaxID=2846775 RepID=UPI001C0C1E4F|nr:hypothetical protein [Subtercola sp. PAMC28395]QWT24934.1 hypothetical protein KPL76_06145 [Subtercola sp. PAMC28395]